MCVNDFEKLQITLYFWSMYAATAWPGPLGWKQEAGGKTQEPRLSTVATK